jgi:hypothetical protein
VKSLTVNNMNKINGEEKCIALLCDVEHQKTDIWGSSSRPSM